MRAARAVQVLCEEITKHLNVQCMWVQWARGGARRGSGEHNEMARADAVRHAVEGGAGEWGCGAATVGRA